MTQPLIDDTHNIKILLLHQEIWLVDITCLQVFVAFFQTCSFAWVTLDKIRRNGPLLEWHYTHRGKGMVPHLCKYYRGKPKNWNITVTLHERQPQVNERFVQQIVRLTSKKTTNSTLFDLCKAKQPLTIWFPALRGSKADSVSMTWWHHVTKNMHVPWCMPGSPTSGFLWSRWQRKRFRHSRRMRNPQFCISGNRPMDKFSMVYARFGVSLVQFMFRNVSKFMHLIISFEHAAMVHCEIRSTQWLVWASVFEPLI